MSISLKKGSKVSLTKREPGLRRILIGLGWDVRADRGHAFDLDAVLFMLGPSGKVLRDEDFIFYNNPRSLCGAVVHKGDNRTGQGDGDDEKIVVDLGKVPPAIRRLVVGVTIHEADLRRQHFGQVKGASIRVVNLETDVEVARYDLALEAATEDAMVFGELERDLDEWHFVAAGTGMAGGLETLAELYGVDVG